MAVDPANDSALAEIASELGADVLSGTLRYPSDTGSWQLGDLDLTEYLDRYRDQRLGVACPWQDLIRVWPLPAEQPCWEDEVQS
jgi:hypothetical protein